jgi:hypothetical protein
MNPNTEINLGIEKKEKKKGEKKESKESRDPVGG